MLLPSAGALNACMAGGWLAQPDNNRVANAPEPSKTIVFIGHS